MQLSSFSMDDRRRVFALLLRMAWADGRLAPDEVSALRGALAVLGLSPAFVRPSRPGVFVAADLPSDPDAGLVGFVASAWLAGVDGAIDDAELGLLRELRRALALPDEVADELLREAAAASFSMSGSARAEMNATRWSIDLFAVLTWTLSMLDAPASAPAR